MRLISALLTSLMAWGMYSSPVLAELETISCIGRIEPLDGVILLAGPSGTSRGASVISELRVQEGDRVDKGQILAVLDDFILRSAEVSRQQVLIEDARVRLKRLQSLSLTQATSRAKLDEARFEVRALEADLLVYQARLEMSHIRSPLKAQVLEVFSRPGEKVGTEGLLELGQTDKMSVVAEVYETDIMRVKVGQAARVSSPALPRVLEGVVSRVGLKIGRIDVLGIDPVARTDARVVETTILFGDDTLPAGLTNLQVDVEIEL